jgi:hypothetical protein
VAIVVHLPGGADVVQPVAQVPHAQLGEPGTDKLEVGIERPGVMQVHVDADAVRKSIRECRCCDLGRGQRLDDADENQHERCTD